MPPARSGEPAGDRQLTLVLSITVPAGDVELVSAELWQLGTVGIEERATSEGAVLRCSFPTDAAAREAATALADSLEVSVIDIADEEWRDTWKAYAEPIDVGSRLRLVPAWRPEHEVGERLHLRIDSGPCFGSGSHPTTRSVLAELERRLAAGMRVLDVGTGSGVLAVAAARLGAGQVDAIDIDPAAVEVTQANAEGNGVGSRVSASTTPLEELDTGSASGGQVAGYDLVVANVSAGTLASLAADLERVTRPDGWLILSGMLPGQWRHVQPRFGGSAVVDVVDADGWTSAVLRRNAAG